ncbi:MAG TPA: NAD(P)H-dependent glycerol-3-phosphate dehydrogenase, partial [Verrucomicrobiae bacterium]
TMWGHNADHLAEMQRTARNEQYLRGVELPRDWRYEADAANAVAEAEFIVVAVPSKAFREVTQCFGKYSGVVVSVTKGIECDGGLTMCGILEKTAPKAKLAALSGPTLAAEVVRGVPTACVAASADDGVAQLVQETFHRPTFRVYTSADLRGVELGGALKNVIAIAAGACDGMGFGDNSKASLVTRGIVEMRRLGVADGAQAETFSGLSGLGDLTVTCFSKLSRNRTLGERLGRGEKLSDILTTTVTVAEGYPTARSAYRLARKLDVYTPIIDEVHAMLHEGKNPKQALRDLITRESKAED